MTTLLPSYKNPPLVETAISVQFRTIDVVGNAHLGLFWDRYLKTTYPKPFDADPIPPQIELFGSEAIRKPRLPQFRIVASQGAARLQSVSDNDQRMVQIQNGRLVYNWRKLTDGTYPRWEVVFPSFNEVFTNFKEYLSREGLGAIDLTQWEVTYVNHFPRNSVWNEPSDFQDLLPGLIGTAGNTQVCEPESVGCNWRFLLPDDGGRLHVDLSHGYASVGTESEQEVLTLHLTARGNFDKYQEFDQAFLQGRNAIVRMFTEITGERAHAIWGREQ